MNYRKLILFDKKTNNCQDKKKKFGYLYVWCMQ